MPVLPNLKKRAAILVAVAAIGLGASACFADVQAGAPPDSLDGQVWNLMNQDRANAGLNGLVYSPKLDNLANNWAISMGTDAGFRHNALGWVLAQPDWGNWYTLGENILVGPGNMNAWQMEAAWMNSAPHRANILNPNFNAVGIGYFTGPDGRLWVAVDFGGL